MRSENGESPVSSRSYVYLLVWKTWRGSLWFIALSCWHWSSAVVAINPIISEIFRDTFTSTHQWSCIGGNSWTRGCMEQLIALSHGATTHAGYNTSNVDVDAEKLQIVKRFTQSFTPEVQKINTMSSSFKINATRYISDQMWNMVKMCPSVPEVWCWIKTRKYYIEVDFLDTKCDGLQWTLGGKKGPIRPGWFQYWFGWCLCWLRVGATTRTIQEPVWEPS